ncbi:ATP-binding cassette domain-containing protein [Cuneatibacter sp. NSJ-177]|uniref:ABC transporter ATP-binding protein n=1 Tax=Cuneatibacter sp. NSJ-177 TaxID=2931401 RepID=UPI001FD470AF|nr:oligopeptide/dipeptide ABC transporter ATP-binding protein [Cuneatibacter sp. NSJ-177]MCJ7833935.1 ATP-binding cassette domain-containing protein [Cuneatibacter sp. NSJ-177]
MAKEILLEAVGLKKYFQTAAGQLHAVDDIYFTIEKGTTLGVVGESGCGKSTLGRVVLHLLESTDGKIIYKGKDITHVDKKRLRELRNEMQIIFQDPFASLNPRMSVRQIISEPLENGGIRGEEREKRITELMTTVGLAERLGDSYPHELDGGRRQRIGVARAIAMNPDFVVCDEPVSALDVSIQAQIINLLQDLQKERGLTYLFISHDLSVVKYLSHQIMVMYLGQTVEWSDTEDLFAHPLHPYTQALLSAVPVPKVGQKKQRILLKGEIVSPINPKPCCRFAKRCLYATEECFAGPPKLKEERPGHFVACHRAKDINQIDK